MMTARFHQWAQETLSAAAGGAVSAVESGGVDDVPFGTRVVFAGGGQLHIQWVRSSSPSGDRDGEGAERVVTREPPAPVPVPDLPSGGKVPVADASRFIAAVLAGGGNPEIDRVDAYADVPGVGSAAQPHGVRVVCHSGAQIFGLLRHTLPAGQHASREAAFRQKETV